MTRVKAAAHARHNGAMTAAVERRLLEAMARRLPAAINSDHLSALGLAAMAAAGLAFTALRVSPWAAAAVLFALAANWLGDSLDGTVARVRGRQRPRYGYYVDHVIDLAGTTLLFAGLACSGLMSPLVAAGVLVGYLLVSAETYLATHAAGVFRISFFGIGPTELRLLLAAGTLRAVRAPFVTLGDWPPLLLFDVGGLAAIAGLAVAFTFSAVRNTRALYAAEPLPALEDSKVA
jgi:archaetidylinositol phosphate synthase